MIVQPPVLNPTRKPLSSTLLILCGLLLATITGVGGYYFGIQSSKTATQPNNKFVEASPTPSSVAVACTMEAKVCPDGSSVGRTGPNCEFAECPVTSHSNQSLTWKVYESNHYSYKISYPNSFTYSKQDAGRGEYEGYIENAHFEKTGSIDTKIADFYVYVIHPVPGSPYDVPSDLIFQQKPSGTYPLDEMDAVYGELPQGYTDGGGSTPPPPLLAVQFAKGGSYYKIIFEGISSINDPLASQVLQSFKFTK